MATKNRRQLSHALVLVMAATCALSVANLYYHQPLLADIQRDLHASVRAVGFVPTLTQIGYALGMLLFVPLGDLMERRRLVIVMLCAVACALVLAALSQQIVWLTGASLLVGMTTITPQLIVPFAAELAPPAERGKVVGTVMSGLLIGILLARTVSGFVGAYLGWRAMYWIAAAMMLALAAVLRALLPETRPSFSGSYRQLMSSLLDLVREQPELREVAVVGALLFGAFSAFWTTLVFLLAGPPYGYGSQAAGLFGLVGAAGALAASLSGRVSDQTSPRNVLGMAVAVTIASFIIFWLLGHHLWGLITGVILLDMGVQGGHVSNQTRIFSLLPQAQNRLNTVYMVSYFLGGSAGSWLGAWSWSVWQWDGVCLLGLGLLGLSLLAFFILGRRKASRGRRTLPRLKPATRTPEIIRPRLP